jgi:hypothetical protein
MKQTKQDYSRIFQIEDIKQYTNLRKASTIIFFIWLIVVVEAYYNLHVLARLFM